MPRQKFCLALRENQQLATNSAVTRIKTIENS
jgi:hypothetical protein